MPGVTSGKLRLSGGDNAGNLDVANFDWMSRPTLAGGDQSGSLGCHLIEGQNTPIEIFVDDLVKSMLKLFPPAPLR